MINLYCSKCTAILLIQVCERNEGFLEITCGKCGTLNNIYLTPNSEDNCLYNNTTVVITSGNKDRCGPDSGS